MAVFEKQENAHAKINFFLRITGQREDGYHLLSTLMQTVALADVLHVVCSDRAAEDGKTPGILLTSDAPGLPLDARNTVYKAARAFLDSLGRQNISVAIHIEKKIPSQAGLAGGSADGAAVLRVLSEMFPGTLSSDELNKVAARIGADVPFCLTGGTLLCQGIGEILTEKESLAGLPLLLVKPNCGIPTPWAFSEYDQYPPDQENSRELERKAMQALFADDHSSIMQRMIHAAPFLFNEFEPIAVRRCPIIQEVQEELLAEGALIARMSGSGSTLFGVFASVEMRDRAFESMQNRFSGRARIFSTETW